MKEPCSATCRVGSINCDGNGWYFSKTRLPAAGSARGILNYCRTKVRFGVVEAINGNIKNPSSKGPWLQESRLSAAQGSTHGGHQDRIHRSSESSLKCGRLRIFVQNPKIYVLIYVSCQTGEERSSHYVYFSVPLLLPVRNCGVDI